jgi:hypothetical protein
MIKSVFLLILCYFILLFACGERQESAQEVSEGKKVVPTQVEEEKEPSLQQVPATQIETCFALDDFNVAPPQREYLPYGPETVKMEEGYGIYFRKADIHISRIALNDTDRVLRIEYGLPPFFSWGNWLSIKREFESLMDLSGCSGLVLDLKVEVASNARLRITMSDVAVPEDSRKHGADEMWWYDFESDILGKSQGWVTLRAPFEGFRISWGEGTRHNNRRKDLSMIVAFEINLISKGDEHPKGVFLVNSLRAYKEVTRN